MFFVQINHTGKGFLFLIFREIKLRKYSSLHKLFYSLELRGNVLHFYLPTYEYNFDKNRIQSDCSVCSTINNILFKEQNMKACNILAEVLGNDKYQE